MTVDVDEQTTGRFVLPLVTAAGAALTFADLTEIRLTLMNALDRRIINGRDGLTIPAPNVAADGTAIVWTVQPADAGMVETSRGYEVHDVLVQYVYGSSNIGRFKGRLRVRNLALGVTPIVDDPPEPDAALWHFYTPLAGALPGHVFTLPSISASIIAVQLFYQGIALNRVNSPGLGEFDFASGTITTGFDVQPGEALWAHVLA